LVGKLEGTLGLKANPLIVGILKWIISGNIRTMKEKLQMKIEAISNLGTRDILACAMLNERIACQDYMVLGELMELKDHPKTAKIFYEASKVERGHFKRLKKTLSKVYGLQVDDSCELPFFALECGGGFGDDTDTVFDGMGEDEAVRYLESIEKSAENFYTEAARVTDRLDLKPLFKGLALEEHNHGLRVRKVARKAQTRDLPIKEEMPARPILEQ
jgi:rubrerythrin